jgi:AcrR family transcriptional regulator
VTIAKSEYVAIARADRKDSPRRLAPEERERRIVAEAVAFFAEHGFAGQTRELARRLGITHALLFHYFPSKEALIARVYDEVFLGRWKPEWETLLADRAVPLRERLVRFYLAYGRAIMTHEWVRLFLFAGLDGQDYNRRYLAFLQERIFPLVMREIRHAAGVSTRRKPRATEIETIWGLHASIFYLGVRQYVYDMPPPEPRDAIVAELVDVFLTGALRRFGDALLPTPSS